MSTPKPIAGLGWRGAATPAALGEALARAEALAGGAPVAALAALASMAGAPALRALAGARGLPVLPIAAEALAGVATPTCSARMIARFGTGSLAEALALVAAGPGARLIAPRHISTDGMATAAIAQRSLP